MRKLKLSGVIWIFAFVFILAGAFFAVPETVEAAEGDVSINEANFPDEVFRGYVEDSFDKNHDKVLSHSEIAAATKIDFYEYFYVLDNEGEIKSLEGIEFFKHLKYLSCEINNKLTELDLSNNIELEELACGQNLFTHLDLSKNINLISLNCNSGNLTSLDVSKNTKLESLVCSYNEISTLDVSKNINLTELSCNNNELQFLDTSHNIQLDYLDCSGNLLSSLDVSKNSNLTELWCADNQLKVLDLNKNTGLTGLYCSNNALDKIDVSNCPELGTISCGYNNLKQFDVTKNTKLGGVSCEYNQIEVLDLSHNPELGLISCTGNKLKVLYIFPEAVLNNLWCSENQLTSLSFGEVADFSCEDNQAEVVVTDENTLDLTTLPGHFDVSKASNWQGGTVNGNILTFTDKKVTYTYNVGTRQSAEFTLIPVKKAPDPINPQPSTPSTQTPAPQTPATPSAPSAPAATEKISANTTVTDAKSNSIYKVAGNAASGYTVTYVRPASKKAKTVAIPAAVTINGVSCKVTSIANNAFRGQKKLKKMTIGANVTTIGKKAFSGCKNLTKIVVKSKKLKKVGAKAFAKINPKAKIKVPKNKKKAYKKVFKKNTGVKASMW